jgi:multisubunit Na+/H+ antiporter MnhB subunit
MNMKERTRKGSEGKRGKKGKKSRNSSKVKVFNVLAGILIVLWGCILAVTLPLHYGPLHEVASDYLERSLQDTGSVNVVAAILADYRLYDTVGEATVLFTAILGVTLILGRNHHKTEEKIEQMDQLYGGSYDGNVHHR